MTAATEDPLGEARKIIAQQKMDSLRAEMDYEIEAREMHIEQLKAQIEAMGVNPVVPSESAEPPLRAAPPLPREPPPSHLYLKSHRRPISETSTNGSTRIGRGSKPEESRVLSDTETGSGATRMR